MRRFVRKGEKCLVRYTLESEPRKALVSLNILLNNKFRLFITQDAFSINASKSHSINIAVDGAVLMSSANGLAGTGFASRYRLQPGFLKAQWVGVMLLQPLLSH